MGVKLGKANATQSTSRGFFLKTSTTCFDPNWVVTHTTTQPHNYPPTPNKKLQEFNTCGLFNVKLSIDWLYLDFTIEAVKNSSCKYRWFDWLVWKSLRLGFLRGFVCSRRHVARPRLRCNAFQKSTQWKNTQKAVFKESFSSMKKRYISTSTWESWVSYIEISFYISFFFLKWNHFLGKLAHEQPSSPAQPEQQPRFSRHPYRIRSHCHGRQDIDVLP